MEKEFLKRFEKNKDELTGLYRRDAISSYMDKLIRDETPFSFVIVDIDNFKTINDSYGHAVGDEALRLVAQSLKKAVQDSGVVGRFGGDEFVFVFPNIVEYDDIWHVLLNLLQSAYDIKIPDTDVSITYTAGCSRYPLDTTNIDVIFNLADKALYRGKVKGRNCFIIYLAEKHGNINLQTIREKVYDPIILHSKIFNMLTNDDDTSNNIKTVLDFIGAYLLIDHICMQENGRLYLDYFQPISKKRDYEPYAEEAITELFNNCSVFYENATLSSREKLKIIDELKKQNIYACCLVEIKCYGKSFGFLRCDMTSVNTGRVWQNDDLVLIETIANQIGLALYIDGLRKLID